MIEIVATLFFVALLGWSFLATVGHAREKVIQDAEAERAWQELTRTETPAPKSDLSEDEESDVVVVG